MNDQELQKNIQERFALLPPDIQRTLASKKMGDELDVISKTNGLSEIQSGKLVLEVFLVLLGIEQVSDFETNLSTELGVVPDVANSINTAVGNEIFSPIIDSIKTLQLNKRDEIPQKPVEQNGAVLGNIANEAEPEESKEEILDAIENPVPANLPTGENTPSIQMPDKKQDAPQSGLGVPKYGGQDPYREPIE